MILRRIPVLAVTAAAAVGIVVVGREAVESTAPTFSAANALEPWMPSAPVITSPSTTWFCPGVPASGEDGVGGTVVIANADPGELRAHVTLLGVDLEPVEQDITVAPHSRASIDVGEAVTSPYASAVVEITGGTGVVEQQAVRPLAGVATATSVAPCTTSASPSWYLAEGFTAEGSVEELILSNPYPQSSIVDIGFATQEGSRQPSELQGYVVPARSVKVIDMAEIAARDEPEVAVSVVATRGTLLVARAQIYGGTDRRGFAVALAAPAPRDQWWFADGEVGPGVAERYSIYNPGDDDAEVTPALLGRDTDTFVPIEAIEVPARQVVTFTPADVPGMPEGRHSMVFGSNPGDLVVVERVLTRTFDDLPTTSVVLGAPPRYEDGYVATTWTMALAAEEAAEDALVVYNVDAVDAVITVQAVGPNGLENVPSLTEVELPAYGLTTIDLTDDAAIGRQLIVRSTSRVFVERLLPRGPGAQGRVGSWPLPVEQ
ncbi:MAG: hypothetical protein H0W46_09320 [Acidimicrobiia bacterium]|nr:hypothetical protein [Acidimicrobiia bacterium]